MCGIAGYQGTFDPALLSRMNDSIAHRGPDDADTLRLEGPGVGLAHRRLSIIDLSPAGRQPMWDASGSAVVVFNGEIFNYRELRAELVSRGCVFRSHSDTEVLLNLYLLEGRRFLSKLNGMFAFAIWDAREGALLLARDAIGVKPLYYAELPEGFLFASEIKALLRHDGLPREIDPRAIHDHLAYLWCPAPRTVLKSVRKLEPGAALVVRDGRIADRFEFYSLPYDRPTETLETDEAAARVRGAIERAVERQMVADVPVGAFLSGGLDSSAVVSFARRHTSSRLQCFTIAFRDDAMKAEGFAEDLPYARRVAAALGVDLHEIEVGPEMADRLETMIWHLDEPVADPAPLNVLFIAELARRHDIKVLLSGAGGDDLFTGYRRHLAVSREGLWSWLPGPVRGAASRAGRGLPTPTPFLRRFRKALGSMGLEGSRRIASYFLWTEPRTQSGLYGPLLADALRDVPTDATLVETLTGLDGDISPLRKMLHLEARHFLADHNLIYTDKMAMARGVEVRVPLLDTDLVAVAASLPDGLKQRGATGKWIFKKAMEPDLPRDVIYRPKTGFGAPIRRWLRRELRPLVDDVLAPATLRERGLFDPGAVLALRRADAEGRVDGTYTLFALVCVELWCRAFLRAETHAPV